MLLLPLLLFVGAFLDIQGEKLFKPCSLSPHLGESKQIVSLTFDENEKKNKFTLNSTELQSILMKPELKDKELAILSIAGAFRKGKSFFLNLLLQILEKGEVNYENINLNKSYGFHWKGGSKRDTQGILMWSEPFCANSKSGRNIAILLMDTQGAFDIEQTFGDSSSIFALSFLMSSIQLYNLEEQIQENDLENLQVFTDYGKVISEQNTDKAFQQIIFLIRDWRYPEDYDYGINGGQKYLDDILAIKSNQSESLKQIRNGLIHSFKNLSCFLMPHPGLKVAKGNFTKKDIDESFINNINSFAKTLFNPEIIITKEFEGQKTIATQLYNTTEIYVKTFENNDTIKPETIHEATCHVKIEYSCEKAQELFTKSMNALCNKAYSVDVEYIKQQYKINKNEDISFFKNATKSCLDYIERSPSCITRLSEIFTQKFEDCKNSNKDKLKNECIINSTRDMNDLEKNYSDNLKAKCDEAPFVKVEELENYFNKSKTNTTQSYDKLKIKNCESDYKKKFEDLEKYIEVENNKCRKTNDYKIDIECRELKLKDLNYAKRNYNKTITEISPNLFDNNTLKEFNDNITIQLISEFNISNAVLCNGKHNEVLDSLIEYLKMYFQASLEKLNKECSTNNTRDIKSVENKFLAQLNYKCDQPPFAKMEQIDELKPATLQSYQSLFVKYCNDQYTKMIDNLQNFMDQNISICNKKRYDKHKSLVDDANRKIYKTTCGSGTSCRSGFKSVNSRACGVTSIHGLDTTGIQYICRICSVDGEELC